jgi:glycosyltransferase involved in cell wall biosynthesis
MQKNIEAAGIELVWGGVEKCVGVIPDITIIIPAYNVAEYVEECICSALSACEGLCSEIIIINDGSKDKTHDVIMAFLDIRRPVFTRYYMQENSGISAVRNTGVRLSSGRFISFLDSDDLLSGLAIKKAYDFAVDNNCDLVFGRSIVFDSKTHAVYPFYDDWAWGGLLKGRPSRVISRGEDPSIFFLEPNPCYRLVRRELFSGGQLDFPVGRFFEDPPVHYKMLALSSRVGLIDIPYYWYRVGRPGKTTTDRSMRRYHILDVANETLKTLSEMSLSAKEGAAVVYGLTRITWWCGLMVQPVHRKDFFEKACIIFARETPIEWAKSFFLQRLPEDISYIVGGALLDGDKDRLVNLSYGRKQPLKTAFTLLKIGRIDLIRQRIVKVKHSFWLRIRNAQSC